MANIGEQVSAAASGVGRYFNVVSSIPSLIFTAYLFALVRSGAWNGPVNFGGVLGENWWKDAVLLGLVSFATAVAIHPLQFQLVRLLEGYWGVSPLGRDLAVLRIRHHRQRTGWLKHQAHRARQSILDSESPTSKDLDTAILAAMVTEAEALRELAGYPPTGDLLPTRLGNALRRTERSAGWAYGLDAVAIAPRIGLVAPPEQVAYLQDQRLQLDLAVRVTVLSLLATLATIVFMLWHGWWILIGLAPYAMAYLSYRGAVVQAGIYGSAVASVIELSRFRLYERFHLKHPQDIQEERAVNEELMAALAHSPTCRLTYQEPPLSS